MHLLCARRLLPPRRQVQVLDQKHQLLESSPSFSARRLRKLAADLCKTMLLQFAIIACVADALQRPRVIIAPAQFGVPKDYVGLKAQLLARGHPRMSTAHHPTPRRPGRSSTHRTKPAWTASSRRTAGTCSSPIHSHSASAGACLWIWRGGGGWLRHSSPVCAWL